MISIGTDIVQISRIQKSYDAQGSRFLNRILSIKEQEIFYARNQSISFLANRYAGKEALAKALGTGISKGINFVDLEILPSDSGRPVVYLQGASAAKLKEMGATQAKISLSDEKDYAVAFAVVC